MHEVAAGWCLGVLLGVLFPALAPPCGAQLEAGSPAPEIPGTWLQSEETSLLELRGHVVVLDFFEKRLWKEEAEEDANEDHDDWQRKSRKTLRDVLKRFGGRGLDVISVSDLAPEKAQRYVERWKITWPLVLVEKQVFTESWGFKEVRDGLVVIDPEGRVSWRGKLYELAWEDSFASRLEELLGRATAIAPLPARFGAINRHLAYGSLALGKAHAAVVRALVKEPDCAELQAARTALETRAGRRTTKARALVGAQDFAAASEVYESIAADWAGSTFADAAKSAKADLLRDPAARPDLAAGKVLADGLRLEQAGKLDEARAKFESILRNYAATKTAERARAALQRIRAG
jgi:peroxiredoxin